MPGSAVEDTDSYWATIEHAARYDPDAVLEALLRLVAARDVVRVLVMTRGIPAGDVCVWAAEAHNERGASP